MRRNCVGLSALVMALVLVLLPLAAILAQESKEPPGTASGVGSGWAGETASGTPVPHPAAVVRQIAFQGFLTNPDGTPVSGTVSLVLKLYDAQIGGMELWSETQDSVAVKTGIFQIALGSVTPLDPTDFAGAPIYLGISVNGEAELPRTQLLASPFAIRAGVADSAVVAQAAGDALWETDGADIWRASGEVGIGTTSPQADLHIEDSGDALVRIIDSTTGNQLMIGTDEDKPEFIRLRPMGGSGLGITNNGDVTALFVSATTGNVGIGRQPGSSNRLHVNGQTVITNATGMGGVLMLDDANGGKVRVCESASDQNSRADIWIEPNREGRLCVRDANGRSVELRGNGRIYLSNASEQSIVLDGITGTTTTKVLTITGGADLAEPFAISKKGGKLPPGSVVVIDEKSPGQLKLSEVAYDARVAGVISGAGGVAPGVILRHPELSSGGRNVALSGRVYVLADASYGAIHPGDFLTTSDTPGHAMKAWDPVRRQGAVIGKAMTGLESGRGLVLVLVSLQ